MGNFLEKPDKDKHTTVGVGSIKSNEVIQWGCSHMQGWRVDMEDTAIHQIPMRRATEEDDAYSKIGLFGVFDGHGGKLVAQYTSENLARFVQLQNEYRDLSSESFDPDLLGGALHEAFMDLDEDMKQLGPIQAGTDQSGSTACVFAITPDHLISANAGDSRMIIVGAGGKVLFGSKDHKPDNPLESKRIVDAGGFVAIKRVNGDLAVSRAMGDFLYKRCADKPAEEQQVSPQPDVVVLPRDVSRDEFVLVACDGIWDVMTNEDAASFVYNKLKAGCGPGETCEALLDECLEKNSKDNLTACLVVLPASPLKSAPKPTSPKPPPPAR